MPRKQPVTIRPFSSVHRPDLKWRVFYPDAQRNKRLEKRFSTKAAADEFARVKGIEILNHGRKSAALKDDVMADAVWASQELAKIGMTLRQAAEECIRRHEAGQKSCSVTEAVDRLLHAKERAGRSILHCDDLRLRLAKFSEVFGDRILSTIETLEVSNWLDGLDVGPVTRNNYRRAVSSLARWGSRKGWCADFTAGTEVATVPDEEPEIFLPGEMRRILHHCPQSLLALIVLEGYGGLRDAEAKRVKWEHIDFQRGHIDLRAAYTKGAKRRLVPMNDALRAWLLPLRQPAGPVAPKGAIGRLKRWRKEMKESGVLEWRHNGLRHSFGSYALALYEDAGRVAGWMGHTSPHILYGHYRALATKQDAEEYFAIRPAIAGGVVSMPATAATA